MHRVTALCAAATIVVSQLVGVAAARPMHTPPSGYYVIRWDNTGVCTIWNTELQEKPWHFFSDYEVVSKPVPTFTEAATIQANMRLSHRCTL